MSDEMQRRREMMMKAVGLGLGPNMSHFRDGEAKSAEEIEADTLCAAIEREDVSGLRALIASDGRDGLLASQALQRAAMHGHAPWLEFLIPVASAKENDSEALRMAAAHGHAECVALLIPVSDPKAKSSEALRNAIGNDRPECVALLLGVSDPNDIERGWGDRSLEELARSMSMPHIAEMIKSFTQTQELSVLIPKKKEQTQVKTSASNGL